MKKSVCTLLLLISSAVFAQESMCYEEIGIICSNGQIDQCLLPHGAATHRCVKPQFEAGNDQITCTSVTGQTVITISDLVLTPVHGEDYLSEVSVKIKSANPNTNSAVAQKFSGYRRESVKSPWYEVSSKSGDKLTFGDTAIRNTAVLNLIGYAPLELFCDN